MTTVTEAEPHRAAGPRDGGALSPRWVMSTPRALTRRDKQARDLCGLPPADPRPQPPHVRNPFYRPPARWPRRCQGHHKQGKSQPGEAQGTVRTECVVVSTGSRTEHGQ